MYSGKQLIGQITPKHSVAGLGMISPAHQEVGAIGGRIKGSHVRQAVKSAGGVKMVGAGRVGMY